MISIQRTQQHHIDNLKPRIRRDDQKELLALGWEPEDALQASFDYAPASSWSFVNEGTGEVLCCVGVTTFNEEEKVGNPWMIASEEAFTSKYKFLVHSKSFFRHLALPYHRLFNIVHEDNVKAIKWLKWLGFKFDQSEPLYHQNMMPKGFMLFTMRFN